MDTLATLLFYLIGLIAFLIVAWLIEGLYFWITGRDEPVDGSHKVGNDYRRHK
jgi:hypothetical protein